MVDREMIEWATREANRGPGHVDVDVDSRAVQDCAVATITALANGDAETIHTMAALWVGAFMAGMAAARSEAARAAVSSHGVDGPPDMGGSGGN